MKKLNITSSVLDRLGFSEYWDEHGTWGGRWLSFSNGVTFQIAEICETDDIYEGYSGMSGDEPTYVAQHYKFWGGFAIPKIDDAVVDLFFLHEMYECIKTHYPHCLDEFTAICNRANMGPYIDDYLLFVSENDG
jgi:hypothetical protein